MCSLMDRLVRGTYKDATIFCLLLKKESFRLICEVEEITMSTPYWEIDFIHRQGLSFAVERERLPLAMPLTCLYIRFD